MKSKYFLGVIALLMLLISSGCEMDYRSKPDDDSTSSTSDEAQRLNSILYLSSSDIDVKTELITNKSNENVIAFSTGEYDYMHYKFTKTGGSSSDEADSSGINSAILAKESATLNVRGSLIVSSGDHAHGIFSHGEGTSIVVSDCVVSVKGPNSSALMTSSSGVITARHVTAETFGSSSPAMRIYDGGGSITAERGKFTTSGENSPIVRAKGNVTVSNAKLEAQSSRAFVIDGKGSITVNSCDVKAGSGFNAVMIYQSGAGNSAANSAAFTMTGGSITSSGTPAFYVTNAEAAITLNNIAITNSTTFLMTEASTWGTSGANGGKVTLLAENQNISGSIIADDLSDLNMYLSENSYFAGAVNSSNSSARIYVEISDSKWVLTDDSYIDGLSCAEDSVTLNGHNLYVAGSAYVEGSESTGTPIDFTLPRTDNNQGITSDDTEITSDDVDAESTVNSLSFDVLNYDTATVNGVAYRGYNNRVYVSKPVSTDYQQLSIYIPEPYFSSRPVNGYTAQTAPIFIPNNSGGYMSASIERPQNNNIIGLALSRGLVVVSPALRGRNTNSGSAPSAIVDYKAVVRYLRANKSRLPAGDTDKIISCGVSSGGALSALLGVSGNSEDYSDWLKAIGAADEKDNIFASVSYCPITNLENADSAYEWVFGGANYGEESVTLSDNFEDYVNNLGLKDGNTDLEIYDYDDESGKTFLRYINQIYADAAQAALDSGTVISADWVKIRGNKVVSADMRKYAESFSTRQKDIPAFDKFDLSSAENSLFGYRHFTEFSSQHSTAGGKIADYSIISAMNPMEYIGNSDSAKFWRIRQGVNDRDITLTIPAILALSLENAECTVNFEAVWGQGHGGYYDTTELFDWIDSICK